MKALPLLLMLALIMAGCLPAASPGSVAPAAGDVPAAARDPSHARWLPDPRMTPGSALDVTPRDFCTSGYTSKVRDVPESVKNQVYEEYGIRARKPGQYEVDHLISLELGGSNSISNLWPQPYEGQWNAHVKDRLEDRLHSLVCDGKLDYRAAQQAIAADWIAAYQTYVGQ